MSAAYETARQLADGRRGVAHRQAHERFHAAREAQLEVWRTSVAALTARVEKLKLSLAALPDDEPSDHKSASLWRYAHEEFRRLDTELIALREQPSDRPLRAQLDREIQEADRAYHAELAALRTQHGISTVPAPR